MHDNETPTGNSPEISTPEGELVDRPQEFVLLLKQHWQKSCDALRPWRKEAKEMYDIVAGNQWPSKDQYKMMEEGRAPVVFNYTDPIINAVCGQEISNRHETTYLPRTVGDSAANEMLGAVAKWVEDECGAADEQSEAFRDMLVTGMGWNETYMDYESDPSGRIIEKHVDPLEMWWDPNATKMNLTDRAYQFRIKVVTIKEARAAFPNLTDDIICQTGPWDKEVRDATGNIDVVSAHDNYDIPDDASPQTQDNQKNTINLVEYQWYDVETNKYRVKLVNGQTVDMTSEQMRLAMLTQEIKDYYPIKERVYKRAFIVGTTLLSVTLSPNPKGFSYCAMTGQYDRNKRCFYGMVRAMKDPQQWSNKYFSQLMRHLDKTAKGGVIIEEDAVDDIRQFEKSWARADQITAVANGTLTAGRLQPKPETPLNPGMVQMMEICKHAIRESTGISLEMLGMAERQQPGVLEYQRRQSGMTILQKYFNSLRKFRQEQGRVLLCFILEYISVGRIFRITQDGQTQNMQFTHEKLPKDEFGNLVDYDVIVDESPTSPNQKERTFEILTNMMPVVKDFMTPEVLMSLMKYSPLPTNVLKEIEQAAEQGGADPEKQQMAQQMQQLAEENEQLKTQSQIKAAEIQSKQQIAQMDNESRLEIERAKMATEMQIAQLRSETEMAKADMEVRLKKQTGQDIEV